MQIRYTLDNYLCSENPLSVVIADECPARYTTEPFFYMNRTGFGAWRRSFYADQFCNLGKIKVECRRYLKAIYLRIRQYPTFLNYKSVDP